MEFGQSQTRISTLSPLSKKRVDPYSVSMYISSMQSDSGSQLEKSNGNVTSTSVNQQSPPKKATKSVHFDKIDEKEKQENRIFKHREKQALILHDINFEIAKALSVAVRKYKLQEQKERAMMRSKVKTQSK